MVVIVAVLGRAFASLRLMHSLKRAHDETLPLELPGLDFLFADGHAVLRYLVLTSGEQFAVGVVGACFWYVIGGLPLMLPYLALAALAVQYRGMAFGWASRSLFSIVDAIPRVIAVALLALAGLFVPKAHPFRALWRASSFQSFLSYLLHVSLGGTLPGRELPWTGEGTAKLLPHHLMRAMLLRVVAAVLLILALSAQDIVKLLN